MAKITSEYSCTLVGKFMSEWAFAEAILDYVIATVLKIDVLRSVVISTTIPVSHKWNIAKTFVNLSPLNNDDVREFNELEKEFNSLIADRNTVAHCMFLPTDDGSAVHFYKFANKGKLNLTGTRGNQDLVTVVEWSEVDFASRFERMDSLRRRLAVFHGKLKSSEPPPPTAFAQAVAGHQTNPFRGLLGGPGQGS